MLICQERTGQIGAVRIGPITITILIDNSAARKPGPVFDPDGLTHHRALWRRAARNEAAWLQVEARSATIEQAPIRETSPRTRTCRARPFRLP